MRKVLFTLFMLCCVCAVQAQKKEGFKKGIHDYAYADGRVYSGEWLDRKPSGKGTMTFANGSKYVGEFKDGLPNGQGTYTYANGDEYVGEWKDDNKNGQGTMTYADGSKYVGQFVDGKRNGQGTYTWPSGSKYVGEWKDGKKNGQGTYTWWEGTKYVGEWKDDNKNGQGTLTQPHGGSAIGEWKDGELLNGSYKNYRTDKDYKEITGEIVDGKLNGQGTLYVYFGYYKGFKYVGEWKDDLYNGQGTLTYVSGSKYVGEWKDGKKNGQGTYTWPNGDEYVGQYVDDKRNGQGTYTYANGDEYVGEWKDDKRNGQGTLTQPDGGLATGEWKDDAFWNGNYKNYRTNDKAIRTGEQVNGNFLSGSCKFIVNGVAFNMIKVSGGTFQMDYFIGETEVTQELWQAVMGSNPSNFKGSKLPVEEVSWSDCQEFIKKLNQLTGQDFRMPREAEWEFAAKGGTKSKGYTYSGSNTIGNVAWYWDNSSKKTHKVATKAPNELGIYDMSGNVEEWCLDWYDRNDLFSSDRVIRGGGWNSYATNCRTALRNSFSPMISFSHIGLRLAL